MTSSRCSTAQTTPLSRETRAPSRRLSPALATCKSSRRGLTSAFLVAVVVTYLAVGCCTRAAGFPTQDDNFYHIEYSETGHQFEIHCSETIRSLNCACPEVMRLYQQHPIELNCAENPKLYDDCCNHRHCCDKQLVCLCRNFTSSGGCVNRTRTPVTVVRSCSYGNY